MFSHTLPELIVGGVRRVWNIHHKPHLAHATTNTFSHTHAELSDGGARRDLDADRHPTQEAYADAHNIAYTPA